MSLPRSRVGAVAILSVVALLTFAGCAAPVTDTDAGGTASATPSPSTSETTGTDEEQEQTDSDGEEDPSQSRVRVGPAAKYGGPAWGDQGDATIIETGVWCKTIAVFWGGDVPQGVRFTFERAVTDRAGLQVEGAACGGAEHACLGLTFGARDPQVLCGLRLRPGAQFEDGTSITFEGRLECPTAESCDIVASRDVTPGPPIVVEQPAQQGDDQNQDQDQDQDNQNQENQDQQDQNENPDPPEQDENPQDEQIPEQQQEGGS